MSKRAAVTAFILEQIDKLAPGGENRKDYETFLNALSDQEFDQYMHDLRDGKKWLTVTVPHQGSKVSTVNSIKVMEALGHDIFQQIWIGPKENEPVYLTPIEYLIMDTPIRRQSQHLAKKRSIPEHSKTIDQLSGQVTGPSKGAKISSHELQILAAMNMDNSLVELIKFRGGDRGGYNAFNAMITRYGAANLKTLNNFSTGVESTKTLKTFLLAAHLGSTL